MVWVNEKGYFGKFGGAYVPEMLHGNLVELREAFARALTDNDFWSRFTSLSHDYAGRPTPLTRADRLSKEVGRTVYLKREDLCHTGSHKINNVLGQVLLAERMGKRRIIAETGAGQHGVATATVCALFGLECIVYMGAIDVARQKPNVERMRYLGAKVVAVESGSKVLKDATNEAIRDWLTHPEDTYYIIGSVVGPHPYPTMVARFQSVISAEIRSQLHEHLGTEHPNAVIACVGGGSNAIGSFYHYIDEPQVDLIGVEAAGKGVHSGHSAATTALGTEGVLHGSRSIVMQTSDGQIVEAESISAGLDYPGIGPQHAALFTNERARYYSVTDTEALAAAKRTAQLEGIVPALETAHALALLWKYPKDHELVVLCLSGRGDKDMNTYLTEGAT
jgi:tryptophan synthase beta chain